MDVDVLTALRAGYDQREQAMAWARRQFPSNSDLINNARIEEVALDAPRVTASERVGDGSYVLVPATDRAHPVGPDCDLDAALRAAAPRQSPCGYHGGEWRTPTALLPLVTPPHIVLLTLCAGCVALLDGIYPLARFVFIEPTSNSPERNDA